MLSSIISNKVIIIDNNVALWKMIYLAILLATLI